MTPSDTPVLPLVTEEPSIDVLMGTDPKLLTIQNLDTIIAHFRGRRQQWAQAEATAQAEGKKRPSVKRVTKAAPGAPLPSLDQLLGGPK